MKNVSFMAIAKGRISTEAGEFKRYIGVAPVKILAVNPTKATLESIYNTTLEKAPEYVSEVERDGKKVPSARIDFIVATDAEKCGVELTTKVSIFVERRAMVNKDGSKMQIIDKYGRTAWATLEDAKNKVIPTYSNGNKANIDADFRPAYVGEETLTQFLQAYLNIPRVDTYKNGSWVMVEDPQYSECRLDTIEDFFKNDFSSLSEAIAYQPENKVKVLFGVKHTDKGDYQDVYNRKFLRNGVGNYTSLAKEVEEAKARGSYPDTEFEVVPVKEYKVASTDVSNDNPFPAPDTNSPWFQG